MKIIYVITYPPAYHYNDDRPPEYSFKNNKNELIGIWTQNRGHIFAKNVKQYFPDIEYEVWQPDYRSNKAISVDIGKGIIHRVFPAKEVTFKAGIKSSKVWFSKEIFEKINSVIKNHSSSKDLLIHIPLDFSYLGYRILAEYKNKCPFLHTSHLNPEILFNTNLATINLLKFIHRLFLKKTFNKYTSFFKEIAAPPGRDEYFKQKTNANIYKLNSLNFDFNWATNKITRNKARQILDLNEDIFVIFSSSRLVPEKQIDKLIKSLASIKSKNFLCIISGSGPLDYEKYLKNLVKKLGLTNKINFVGYLTKDLINYYCASDAFISTSKSEAGPVSVIKALALETPVITTDTGVGAYLLKDKKAGIILDKNNVNQWLKILRDVVSNKIVIKTIDSKELEQEYNLEKSIRQLVIYYQEAINNYWLSN